MLPSHEEYHVHQGVKRKTENQAAKEDSKDSHAEHEGESSRGDDEERESDGGELEGDTEVAVGEAQEEDKVVNDGEVPENGEEKMDESQGQRENKKNEVHKIAGLDCAVYGGPEDPQEMVYWEDIPSDASHVSPLKAAGPEIKYLTFEPDLGGWNNIRMSMETAVTLAHAMGRTLVLPPRQGMYLLEDGEGNQKRRFSFSDFFHFDSVAIEHAGVEVISMEEFLEREVMTGNMKENVNGSTTFPPLNNRTKWDDAPMHEIEMLNKWMRTFTRIPLWNTDECMVGIPSRPGPAGPGRLNQISQEMHGRTYEDRRKKYVGKPVAFNAPPADRLDELLVNRQKLCVYDEDHQNAEVIHMVGESDLRLLIHFYAFLFFEDWRHDLWTKRFVRDHIRYSDEIQCPAARVVKAMRQKAIDHGNVDGIFDTMHIRRGDFQYKDTRIEADAIYDNMKELIPEGTTVFIATDERNKDFFKIFHEHFHVFFLDDFKHELVGVNTNFYGMIDQRVASRGRSFIGCYYSTFTGYINRMRGYHSQKVKAEGWERGVINSWYYIPIEYKEAVRDYWPLSPPLWAREFPSAWRDLDHGIAELAAGQQ